MAAFHAKVGEYAWKVKAEPRVQILILWAAQKLDDMVPEDLFINTCPVRWKEYILLPQNEVYNFLLMRVIDILYKERILRMLDEGRHSNWFLDKIKIADSAILAIKSSMIRGMLKTATPMYEREIITDADLLQKYL